MEKSEKAKQLRALRKYGKKVRRKVCGGHRMLLSVCQPGVPGSDLVLCPVSVPSCVDYCTAEGGCVLGFVNTIFP